MTDHGSPTIAISWSSARQLFNHYKPTSVPEFDSYKSSTISAELETLLKRLTLIVPAAAQPDPHTVSVIDSYLNKGATKEEVLQLHVPRNECVEDSNYVTQRIL